MEMHKRRKAISEPETRYFMRQIVLACQYLHEHKIIHRDLKLGNLFLNDDMELKIGDFGLATKVDFEGERKKWVYIQYIRFHSIHCFISLNVLQDIVRYT